MHGSLWEALLQVGRTPHCEHGLLEGAQASLHLCDSSSELQPWQLLRYFLNLLRMENSLGVCWPLDSELLFRALSPPLPSFHRVWEGLLHPGSRELSGPCPPGSRVPEMETTAMICDRSAMNRRSRI